MKKSSKVSSLEKSTIPAEVTDYFSPLEIKVFGNGFERAMKTFRSVVQSEKILSDYKEKSRYEKPSDKKRRKQSESIQRAFEEEMKMKKILSGEYEKDKAKKLLKKEQDMRMKADKNKESEGV